jgi:hypothetical protein
VLRDGFAGTFEDSPAWATWVGILPHGRNVVEVRLMVRPREAVGVPYVDPPQVGLDSLRVTMIGGSD